jgi:hypothetical protein
MKSALRLLDHCRLGKKIFVLCTLCLCEIRLWGQGTVYFSNQLIPPGIVNSLTGERAEAGTTFSVALYFASDGMIDESEFLQLGPSVNIGVFGGMVHPEAAGYFFGGIRTAPVFPSTFGMFQVRAWETSFGSTFEEAVGNPNPQSGRLALVGQSGIMRVLMGNSTIPEPIPPTSLVSADPFKVMAVVGAPLRDGFVLTVVPEPSAALLLLFGLPLLIFLQRGHRRR